MRDTGRTAPGRGLAYRGAVQVEELRDVADRLLNMGIYRVGGETAERRRQPGQVVLEGVNGSERERERGEADTDVTFGARGGYWFADQGLPWLGIALDVSYFEPEFVAKDGSGTLVKAKVRTVPISPLVMFRLPLLESPDFPTGQLQLYTAAGPGFFWTETTARFLSGTAERISDDTIQVGVDFRAGVSYQVVPNVAVFAEYRFTYYSISPEGRSDGQRTKLEADFDTHHLLAGVGFRFR